MGCLRDSYPAAQPEKFAACLAQPVGSSLLVERLVVSMDSVPDQAAWWRPFALAWLAVLVLGFAQPPLC